MHNALGTFVEKYRPTYIGGILYEINKFFNGNYTYIDCL